MYCPKCGTEVDDVTFCPECGTEITTEHEVHGSENSPEESETESGWRSYLPESWQIGVAGAVMGLIAGGIIAWGLANIGGSAGGFVIGWVLVTVFLWQKPTGVGVFGSGLYICSLLLVLVPLFFYGPYVFAEEDPQSAEEVGMAIGGFIGLFVWTIVFAVIAAVMGAIGYFFKKRQSKKLD